MGIRGVKIDDNRIIDAVHKCRGVLQHAAKMLHCTADAIYNAMERNKFVEDAVREAREKRQRDDEDENLIIVNKARASLIALLDKCDVTATIFTMRTKGGFEQKDMQDNTVNVFVDSQPYQSKEEKAVVTDKK